LDTDHVRSIVRAYQALGFTTAIDDFGSGHAGLGLLANLQTDAIKLDMDLIRNLDTSLARRQIVKSLVNLSREMGLLLVAEGIETQEELRVLEDIGVRYVQGYLFAQPQIGTLPHVGEIVPALRSAG
jgi:EAL domain-containing protein (putative c-di-GMP-specific phosphodiesterase class I)